MLQGNVTPWFEDYRHAFFKLLRGTTHDSFSVPICCVCVVSTAHPEAVAAFATLYDPLNPPSPLSEPWVDPVLLKAYVLLHDVAQDGVSREQYVH